MRKKANLFWLGGQLGFDFAGESQLTGANGIRVQYRTTDFAYQTTNPNWTDTDTETFKAGSNVISINQVLPNNTTKAVTGSGYYQDANGVLDYLVFCDAGNGGSNEAIFFNRSFVEQFRVSNAVQTCEIDSINGHVYSWIMSPNRILVQDFNNNVIETLPITTSYVQGSLAYNQYTGDLFLAPETTSNRIQRHRRVGSEWVLQETLWFSAIDGVSVDNIFNRLVNFPFSGSQATFRYQSTDGLSRCKIFSAPLNPGSTFNTEGLVIDPRDGTIWFSDPSGFSIHGGITNGNRVWHVDPEKLYLKYMNFPHMVPLTKFKHNGTVTGQLSKQKIQGATSILFPIINFTGFTNQQNSTAWQDMDGNELIGLEFRGSDTAPTTASTQPIACDISYYDANAINDGWGDTIPSGWVSTPPTTNYVQARAAQSQPSPEDLITLSDLVSGLNGKCKILLAMHDDELMNVYPNDSNRIYVAPNYAIPLGFFSNNTTPQTPVWVDGNPGYARDNAANNNLFSNQLSDVSSDQLGTIIVVGKRDVTTSRAIHLAMNQTTTNNHQLRFRHNASSDSPASEICIEYIDGTGVVIDRVGVADSSSIFKRLDYSSDGASWKIKINGVEQVLNVSAGTNTGRWFGDLVSPTRLSTGIVQATTLVTGLSQTRLLIVCSDVLTEAENQLVDAYILQENLLA